MRTSLETRKLELHLSPIIFHIAKEDGQGKIGRAVIREGSLTWYPGNAQKGHRIRWERLGELIAGEIPKRKRRKVRGK